jgi:hypothetical protein
MCSQSRNERSVPPGGPATINGILYQLLWTLLRLSRLRIESRVVDEVGEINEVIVTAEPLGGGGDLVVHVRGRRSVEQLKARPDGGPWSLREIVESVIPDLYLACREKTADANFRFITEGRLGGWMKVYDFFQSLKAREKPHDDLLNGLDDTGDLPFRKGKATGTDGDESRVPFWDKESYTERSLFERIVAEVRKRSVVSDRERAEMTRAKLWDLLGEFEFVGGQRMDLVQREIDSHLLAVVDRNDAIPQLRDAMAFDLGRRATAGSAEIDVEQFFRSHGLNAIPLTDWSALRARAHGDADTYLRLHGYAADDDLRRDAAATALGAWPRPSPMLALTGESGQGKSWRAYAMAFLARPDAELVLLIDATGDADSTQARCAEGVWQGIAGHDEVIPVSRIADRIRAVLRSTISTWLLLVIDGVQDQDEANRLARLPWEEWGIRVIFTCPPQIALQIQQASLGRCVIAEVGDFSVDELQQYLSRFLGDDWPAMPEYMRNSLRRPLLAKLYRETVNDPRWQPDSEYEFFAAYWSRMADRDPFDPLRLKRIVRESLELARYPWSCRQLFDAGFDAEALQRVERSGWMRSVIDSRERKFEIAHDRLLNWAVAEALVEELRERHFTPNQLADKLQAFLKGALGMGGRFLGFVATDAIWLMLRDRALKDGVPEFVASLEGHGVQTESFYRRLATLGRPIANTLLCRLSATAGDRIKSLTIAEVLASFGAAEIQNGVREMLNSNDPLLQRAAMQVLVRVPLPETLDRLWQLHTQVVAEPARFLTEHENKFKALHHQVYEESFGALREGCRFKPDWLQAAIQRADSSTEPVHDLAYLVAAIGGTVGQELWQQVKAGLFAKVRLERQRCLASCTRQYGDKDETPWLVKQLHREDGFVGAMAMSALARIDPEVAIEHLDALPIQELSPAKSWYVDRLFATQSDALRAKLLAMMRDADNPWKIADVYQGRQHRLDVATVDFLLDDLLIRLVEVLSLPDWGSSQPLYGPMRLLAQVNTLELLERMAQRNGTPLEVSLRDFLQRIGPQSGQFADAPVRDEALEVLYRIGGEGYAEVINAFLRAESRYARLDAIQLSINRHNAETRQLLSAITESDVSWDGYPLEQNEAAKALADIGEWAPVIRFLERYGLRTFSGLTDFPRYGFRPTSDRIDGVRAKVRSLGAQCGPGPVLTLGFGGEGDVDLARGVLAEADTQSDLAHACTITLELLKDHSELSVPLLARQLEIAGHESSATIALLVNGTQAALKALSQHYGDHFEAGVAAALINVLKPTASAIDQVRQMLLTEVKEPQLSGRIAAMISRISDPTAIQQVMELHAIKERTRDEAFADEGQSWIVGEKAAAIRNLATFDPAAAILGAKTALKNPNGHDRQYYPDLLVGLQHKEALAFLVQELKSEKSNRVAGAVGRALSVLDNDSEFLQLMSSADAHERRVACLVAGWAGKSSILEAGLQERVSDEDDKVSLAAAAALDRIAVRRETRLLSGAFDAEKGEARCRLLFHCLLRLADPGDDHVPWSIEGLAIGERLSPYRITLAMRQVKELRRAAAKD